MPAALKKSVPAVEPSMATAGPYTAVLPVYTDVDHAAPASATLTPDEEKACTSRKLSVAVPGVLTIFR